MCKIMVIPKIGKGKEKKAMAFAKVISPIMTKKDFDGLGYMALGDNGIFGERWLEPLIAWKKRPVISKIDRDVIKNYKFSVGPKYSYNQFGKRTERIYCLALHARMATCGISLSNVHPFVSGDGKTALIHNGVITNHDLLTKKFSTCDSEVILHEYDDCSVKDEISKIQQVADNLWGWYACAVISQNSDGKWLLDIFKEMQANLTVTYVHQLDSVVFCTDGEMIKEACKRLKWQYSTILDVEPDVIIRHDAMTGEVLQVQAFESDRYDKDWKEMVNYKGGPASRYYPQETSTTSDDGPSPQSEADTMQRCDSCDDLVSITYKIEHEGLCRRCAFPEDDTTPIGKTFKINS